MQLPLITLRRAIAAVLILGGALALAQNRPTPELVLQSGHASVIVRLAFTPNGRWLASASADKTIKLWDVATGQEVRTFAGHGYTLDNMAISPSGDLLASADGRELKLWEVATGRPILSLEEAVGFVVFSPNGNSMATLIWNSSMKRREVKLRAVPTGKELETLPTPCARQGKPFYATDASFHPTGRFLAVACSDSTVRMLEPGAGREVRAFQGPQEEQPGKTRATTAVRFTKDGRLIAAFAEWSEKPVLTIKIWDVDTGKELRTIAEPQPGFYSLELSSDGNWVASSSSGKIKRWETSTGNELPALPAQGNTYALAASPDGRWLASGGFDRTIRLWDVATGREVRTMAAQTSAVSAVHVGRAGRSLLFNNSWRTHSVFRMFDSGTARLTDLVRFPNLPSPVEAAQVAYLLPEIQKARARLQGLEIVPPPLVFYAVGDVGGALSSGWRLAAVGAQKSVRVWDLSTFREVLSAVKEKNRFLSVAFSPDAKRLAAGDSEGNVQIWDLAKPQEPVTFGSSRGAAFALAFSPDGRYLAAGNSDNTVTIWNADALTEIRTLATPSWGAAFCAAFSADGRWLAMGSGDNTVRLWDVTSGRELRSFKGHSSWITSVAFDPEGRWLVSGSADGSLRLWDPKNGEHIASLIATDESTDWLAVTPEGLFDGSEKGMQNLVSWRIGGRLYAADRFFKDFYTPGLMARLLAGERPKPTVDLAGLRLPPDVHIISPQPGNVTRANTVVDVDIQDQGGGLSEVRVYQNGKLVASDSTGAIKKYKFEVRLIPGENNLKVAALSREGVESNDDFVRLVYEGSPSGKPTLRLLVVGINRYQDTSFNLGFARQDGEAIARFFEQKGGSLFGEVKVRRFFDSDATGPAIRRELERLSEEAEPEDVVITYLAGHGVSLGQVFYFLPHEMRKGDDEQASIRKYGIPAFAIGNDLKRIRALKQVLVLDTCQSGAALDLLAKQVGFRSLGQAEEKAARMLARSTGIHLIAAATRQQYAVEIPALGHGVLTQALLQGLGEKSPPAALPPGQEVLTMKLLSAYVEQQVEELTEKYHNGERQTPYIINAQDFPLLVRSAN